MKRLALILLLTTAKASPPDAFFVALGAVEASKRPTAYNRREQAVGLYQIRAPYLRDSGLPYKLADMRDPRKARAVVEAYMRRYEPRAWDVGDIDTLARLHNAGPSWRAKRGTTDAYVKRLLYALQTTARRRANRTS